MENKQKSLTLKELINNKEICIEEIIPIIEMEYPSTNIKYLEFLLNSSLNKTDDTISLEPFSKNISLANYRISTEFNQYDIDKTKEMGIDINVLFMNTLYNEVAQNIIKGIVKNIITLSEFNKIQLNFLDKIKKFILGLFGKYYKKIYTINNAQDLYKLILRESAKIAKTTFRGPADFIIGSPKTISILCDLPAFVFNTFNENKTSLYYVGTLNNIKVYTYNYLPVNDVIIGRSIKSEESGVYLAIDTKPINIEKIQLLKGDSDKLQLNTRYSVFDLGFTAKENYRKITYKNKK
ncbi:hypothetical protein M0Q50_06515 [bacterium]|jgi:hypothetical protein|nr:hypothetical protein [bacterium]